ncbi:MAG: GAF domain-containing protein, partial [Proteobacteria bacterium]
SYPYLRFLKALGTTLLPIVLISSFLATGEDKKKERRRLEFWNNLVGAVLAGVSAVLLFRFSSTTVRFTENFNAILVLTLVYSTLALAFLVTHLTKLAIKKNLDLQAVAVHGFYGLFLSIGFIGAAAALKRSALSDYVSESVRSSAITLTMATPVLFGLAVMAFAVVEHIRQTHLARDQKSRDDFALEVLHLIHDSSDSVTAAKEIHRRLTTFVGATRSTLFIAHSNQGLVPLSQVGTHLIAARGDHGPNQKILTHVLDSNSPLFISDVSKDLRFASPQAPSSYSTGSCMVLPLRTMGQKRGVITFADKKDGNAFTDADFALVLEVSSTLALLINAEGSKVLHLAA